MKELASPNQASDQKFYLDNKEIDLGQILSSFSRHKFLIAKITTLVVIFSGIYAFTRKPTWEGHFQIVLEDNNSNSANMSQASANSLPAFLAGFGGGGNNELRTEVKVLESPSVLKPTFDFVRENKAKKGISTNNLKFASWRDNNLNIELEEDTSVLNITYRDTERDLILPVITKISSDYQLYSGRDRSRSISNGLAFTKKQVEKFRKKSAKSSRALDAFSIRYGISSSGGPMDSNNIDIAKLLGSSTRFGQSFASKLVGSEISPLNKKYGDPLGQLAAVNQEIIRRKQRFTDRDPGVLALIRERNALRNYIEITAGGSITLMDQQKGNKEQSQELILRFQELKRTAQRDLLTLNNLESSLLSLQLEQARQTDPWELISNPTLMDQPVAPHKARLISLGFLGGLILGCGAALINDRRSGLVFSEEELKSFLPCPLLKHLPAISKESWRDTADLLVSGPLSESSVTSSIALIPLGNIPDYQLQAFSSELSRALNGRELIISSDLRETRSCSTQLLIAMLGTTTRTQLSQLRQELSLQGTPTAGWILIDPELNLQ